MSLKDPLRLDTDFEKTAKVLAWHLFDHPELSSETIHALLLRLAHCDLESIVRVRGGIFQETIQPCCVHYYDGGARGILEA